MTVVLFTTYGWYQKTIIKRYSLPRYSYLKFKKLKEEKIDFFSDEICFASSRQQVAIKSRFENLV